MTHVFGHKGSHGPAGMKIPSSTKTYGQPGYVASTPHHQKIGDFHKMSQKEITERFNKNQQKYFDNFKKKNPRPLTSEYGYGIPEHDGFKNKKDEIRYKNFQERKYYRSTYDIKSPEIQAKNEKALKDKLDLKRMENTGYFHRVNKTSDYFNSLAINAKQKYISPDMNWWERNLRANAIDAWYSTGNTLVGTMEGALGLTLDPVAYNIGSISANANDLWRAINGLPYSAKENNRIATSIQNHIIGSTMAYWESTGFGAMRLPKYPTPSVSASANYAFKNSQNIINNALKNKKKSAKNMTIDGEFKVIYENSVKNSIVKKEIQAEAITRWESENMSAIGVDVANAIANQIRVKSGIEARSLGAAATPKDLLPLGDPFFNPIDRVIEDLPEIITVSDLKNSFSTKKLQRVIRGTGLNNFIGELESSGKSTVTKKELVEYSQNNPWKINTKVLKKSVINPEYKEKYDTAVDTVSGSYNVIKHNLGNVIYQRFVGPDGLKTDVGTVQTSLDGEFKREYNNFHYNRVTEPIIFDKVSENYIQGIRENTLAGVSGAENWNNFDIGKFKIMDMIPTGDRGIAEKSLKRTIMLSLGYVPSDSVVPSGVKGEFDTYYKIPIVPGVTFNKKPIEEVVIQRKNWVEELFNNFEGRTGYVYEPNEFGEGFDAQLQDEALTSLVYNLEANDLPDWSSFINTLKADKGYITKDENIAYMLRLRDKIQGESKVPSFSEAVTKIQENNKLIKEIEQKSKKTSATEGGLYEYIDDRPVSVDYEVHGGATFTHSFSKGNWQEIQIHTNKLTGYPDYGDIHFPNPKTDKNLIGWTLGYERPVLTSGKYAGNRVLSIEEIQSSRPTTEFPTSTLWKTDKATSTPTLGERLKQTMEGGIQYGPPYYGSWTSPVKILETKGFGAEAQYKVISKKDFEAINRDWSTALETSPWISEAQLRKEMAKGDIGKSDWATKVLWQTIRYAYDMGMDFITLPTGKTMKHKKGGEGIEYTYGEVLPNISNKLGFPMKFEKMQDMGINVPKNFVPEEGGDTIHDFFMESYGDDKVNVIDLRDKEKIKEILSIPQPVASLAPSLNNQMKELFKFV